MHIAWTQAVLYQSPAVLGRQLAPLSPLHVLTLEAVNSPFMVGGVSGLDDLILAVHICATQWGTRAGIFANEKLLRKWGRQHRRADWRAEMGAFHTYLDESWTTPDKWGKGASGAAKAPGAYHLAVFAMRNLGMAEAQAWDCPIARLICYREAFAEQERGESDLMTDEEKRGIEVLKTDERKRHGAG